MDILKVRMGQDIWSGDVDHIYWDYCPIYIGNDPVPASLVPCLPAATLKITYYQH